MTELLRLKTEYKNLTGEDLAGGGKGKKDKKKEGGKENDKKNAKQSKKEEKKAEPSNVENGDADSGAKKV